MVKKRQIVLALLLAMAAGYGYFNYTRGKSPDPWNASAVTATYRSAQLRETGPSGASLLLSYDLENNTEFDYTFTDAAGLVIMSRLKSNQSLSSQEDIRLDRSTFLPARQRARITLQLRHSFAWPAVDDPAFQNKLKEFVNERLAGVEEFVLFDQVNRCQIAFPRGWEDLRAVSAALN